MASGENSSIRENGIFYTPALLAKILVTPIISRPDLSIFDPACGEGALLFAAKAACDELSGSCSRPPEFFGCDKIVPGSSLHAIGSFHFFEADFLKLAVPDRRFDVILMNPPFVRHHLISKEDLQEYREQTDRICPIKGTADLWAYFLLKSTGLLKKGSSMGAVLPWSFLQADYSFGIRNWLLQNFQEIRILVLADEYFEEASERVLLVWMTGYGTKTKSIKIGFSQNLNSYAEYFEIPKSRWLAAKVILSQGSDIEGLLGRYIREFGFSRFRDFAEVRIGVVTGADTFFITESETAKDIGFDESQLIPILCSSRELSGFSLDGYDAGMRLLVFPKRPAKRLREYLKQAVKAGYHLRSHSLRRSPWYSVQTGPIPDAFFPYRAYDTPYLVLNPQGVQSTNSVHRIYFRELTENAKRWIQVSLLSAVGQLSLEAYSKTYGKGMLKIEPSCLKNALTLTAMEEIPKRSYDEIAREIINGRKRNAVQLASQFLDDTLNIPRTLSKETVAALFELQSLRLNRVRFQRRRNEVVQKN